MQNGMADLRHVRPAVLVHLALALASGRRTVHEIRAIQPWYAIAGTGGTRRSDDSCSAGEAAALAAPLPCGADGRLVMSARLAALGFAAGIVAPELGPAAPKGIRWIAGCTGRIVRDLQAHAPPARELGAAAKPGIAGRPVAATDGGALRLSLHVAEILTEVHTAGRHGIGHTTLPHLLGE